MKRAQVLATLSEKPALAKVFEVCVGALAAPGRAIAVTGSAARGSIDRFSDLDLIVWAAPGEGLDLVMSDVSHVAARIGETLASYRGTHLGRPLLVVTYSLVAGTVVKTDIELLPAGTPAPAEHLVAVAGGPPPPLSPDQPVTAPLADMLVRATGWTWFTYAKIARGEYFAAARAIDFTRENALLPMLLRQHGLPQDGHRHVEDRVPDEALRRLHRTYPSRPAPAELLRAFDELTTYLCQLADEVCGREEAAPRAALHRMIGMVRADPQWTALAGGTDG